MMYVTLMILSLLGATVHQHLPAQAHSVSSEMPYKKLTGDDSEDTREMMDHMNRGQVELASHQASIERNDGDKNYSVMEGDTRKCNTSKDKRIKDSQPQEQSYAVTKNGGQNT